jgi:hypothetical protein
MTTPEFCDKCGTKILSDSIFCDGCGAPVAHDTEGVQSAGQPSVPQQTAAVTVFCGHCGAKQTADAGFCDNCGKPVRKAADRQTLPPPSTPAAAQPPSPPDPPPAPAECWPTQATPAQTRHFGPKSVVVLGVVAGIAAVIVYWFMFMSVEVACGMIDGGGKWTQAKGGAITVYLEAGEEQNLGIIGIGGQKPYTCEWTWTGNIEDYDVRYDSSTLKNRSPSARIKFTKAGTRVAKVTVRDSGYRSGTATVTINVVPKGQRPKQ